MRLVIAAVLMLGAVHAAQTRWDSRRALLQTIPDSAYPAIESINCTAATPTVPIPDFDITSTLTTAITQLNAGLLNSLGVEPQCSVLTSFTSPLISCLSDLGNQEGCCSNACYQAVYSTFQPNSGLEQCFGELLIALCTVEGTTDDPDTKAALTSLAGSLFSMLRRCILGKTNNCQLVLAPPALSPSPSPSPAPSPSPSPSPSPLASPSPSPAATPSPSPSPSPSQAASPPPYAVPPPYYGTPPPYYGPYGPYGPYGYGSYGTYPPPPSYSTPYPPPSPAA